MDLVSAPPVWITAAVRIEVRRRLRGWQNQRIAMMEENDLVQQIYVALFENDCAALRRFDPSRGEPIPYLRDFARKRLIELERKVLRRETLFEPAGRSIELMNRADTPEEWLEYFEKRDQLIGYLKRHGSPEDVEIFHLSVVKGLSNPEIAKIKRVSVDHVANRKFAIRKHARACFAQLDRDGGSNE